MLTQDRGNRGAIAATPSQSTDRAASSANDLAGASFGMPDLSTSRDAFRMSLTPPVEPEAPRHKSFGHALVAGALETLNRVPISELTQPGAASAIRDPRFVNRQTAAPDVDPTTQPGTGPNAQQAKDQTTGPTTPQSNIGRLKQSLRSLADSVGLARVYDAVESFVESAIDAVSSPTRQDPRPTENRTSSPWADDHVETTTETIPTPTLFTAERTTERDELSDTDWAAMGSSLAKAFEQVGTSTLAEIRQAHQRAEQQEIARERHERKVETELMTRALSDGVLSAGEMDIITSLRVDGPFSLNEGDVRARMEVQQTREKEAERTVRALNPDWTLAS